jgi:hypothetical protein
MSQPVTVRRVGFVGVRGGLTYAQFRALSRVLIDRDLPGAVTGVVDVVRGDDGWGDADFDRIARWMTPTPNLVVVGAPDPSGPPAAAAVRNRAVVDACDLVVACPPGAVEEPRSRTWAAVRYARRVGRPVVLIYPNGTTDPGARPVFLAVDRGAAEPVSVFVTRDPRADGFRFPVVPVLLETLPASNRAGGSGTATARPCLGRSTSGAHWFREFASRKALARAGFVAVGLYRVCDAWDDYVDPWQTRAADAGGETDGPLHQARTDQMELPRPEAAAAEA